MVPEPLRAAPAPEDLPRIPGYALEGVIGRGAAGTVYRARQLALDRDVALKVLHPDVARNRRTVQRLQREARTTARLAHPHIVGAVAIGETDGLHWYAMSLVDGPSLAQVLRREGRLSEREALRLFIPLCEALEHLYENGVVHRDVKPANILIDRTSGAQLADLGLAFADDDPTLTKQGTTLGTPHYVSPEQAMDPASADARSDIWSFGATLYHAVCGRPPFSGDSTAEVLSAVLRARVPDPRRFEPGLSRGLALILRKCLTRDPADRYQTPRELLLDLERVRERRAPKVVARSLDPVERAPKPWLLPALSAAAVALGLGLVVALATTLAPGEVLPPRDEEPGRARYAPLDALAARAQIAPEDAGAHLRELEDMAPRVPPELAAERDVLASELKSRVRAQVALEADRAGAEADRLVRAGDFVGARAALEVDLVRRLTGTTGFALPELEERFGFLRARRLAHLARVEEAEAQNAAVVARKVEDHVGRLVAEAERLRAARRFRSALALLAVNPEDLLAAVGYAGYRFPPERVDDVLAEQRARIEVQRQAVVFAWRDVDAELRELVERRAEEIRAAISPAEEPSMPAAQELEAAFEQDLFDRGLSREEMPEGLTRFALDRLEQAALELAADEDEARHARYREAYDLNGELDAARWRRRDYDAVAALWSGFVDELAAARGDLARRWRVDLAQRARLRVEEARMLRGLLDRAAEGVRAADGSVRELRVLSSSILEEGRVEAGPDPLEDGFALVTERGQTFRLDLRSLPGRDLLELAGMPSIDVDLAPEDRLLAAAFRFHEGELARADATLRSGELPRHGISGELARDLAARIRSALERRQEAHEARDEEVSLLLALCTEQAMLQAPDRALMAIDKLLTEHADAPDVRLLRAKLAEDQRRLEARPRSLEDAYRPDSIQELQGDRVELGFRFDGPEVGAWEAQAWRFDGEGWSAPAVAADWSELERRYGARLILRPPLDPGREVELEIAFRVVDPEAPAQGLVVSLLGVHAAITGPGVPAADPRSRWRIGTGGLGELLADLRSGKGEERPRLLRPGEDQVLRLTVHARRGVAELHLDGELLARHSFPGRAPEPLSVVLRSLDPIRVTGVRVRGSR